jgi:predicted adenylyl cyclase CyaB
MPHLNIEIKAKCSHPEKIRQMLAGLQARFVGEDHQMDTYFNIKNGRLKLREGNIENNLIHYNRSNQAGPKRSEVTLYKSQPGSSLKALLTNALGVKIVVDKIRSIFFIDNVKFHVDQVKTLGSFVEIEAIDEDGSIGEEKLLEQCQYYMTLFEINNKDLIEVSYSDLLLEQN